MAKFVVIYSGGTGMGETPEKQQEIMADWGAWYGQLGESVADGGAPFGASKNITSTGVSDGPGTVPATGYTIITADSIDAATEACQNHPHIKHGGSVHLFEYINMQG